MIYITGLIALINEHIDTMDAGDARSEVEAHFRNTLQHIELLKTRDDSIYAPVELS